MLQEIEISRLRNHPQNVRRTYGDIEELADSIKKNGVMQNLTVIPDPEKEGCYLVVIGNRRLMAAQKAGLETVPCQIADMDPKTVAETMLLENMQRNDLSIIDQAYGFQLCLDLGDTAKISNLAYITPFLSLLWTSCFLPGDPFNIWALAGLCVIVLGIFIQLKDK